VSEEKSCGTCARWQRNRPPIMTGTCPLKPGQNYSASDNNGCMGWMAKEQDPAYCFDCKYPCKKGERA
jgi:hypothetical protein